MDKSTQLTPRASSISQKCATQRRFLSSREMIDFFKEGIQKDAIND
jgi:hypothetical protein